MRDNRANYRISVKDGGQVAGYDTHLIEITGSVGSVQKLWVDKKGLGILKRDTGTNSHGQGMYYEYSRFKYLSVIDPKEFSIDKPNAKVLKPEDRLKLYAKDLGYVPYKLVADKFRLNGARIQESGSEGSERKALVGFYADGHVFLSLMQRNGEFDVERLRRGSEGRRFQVHVWEQDGYHFILMGDLPLSELKRLSKLVRQ